MTPFTRNLKPADTQHLVHILVTKERAALTDLVPSKMLQFTEAESTTNWLKTRNHGLPDEDFILILQLDSGAPLGCTWGSQSDESGFQGKLKQIAILPKNQGRGHGKR